MYWCISYASEDDEGLELLFDFMVRPTARPIAIAAMTKNRTKAITKRRRRPQIVG